MKVKELLNNVKNFFGSSCYNEMMKNGYACNNKCSGLSGGDKSTGYLSYNCIGCTYLDLTASIVNDDICDGCFGAANNDCRHCTRRG